MKKPPLKQLIRNQLSRCWKRHVFTRQDFVKLADYDQVGRALRTLVQEGYLIKIGYGLYAKSRINRITGQPMIAAQGGFQQVAQEALDLLGVTWQPSDSEQRYNTGATQIPMGNPEVKVSSRFNRKITTKKYQLNIAQ
ncbi:MAG: DUF6088 family protein [Gammaproteobacteria bacterium]